jgi:NAD(P)-dependent dehydrogenase (short-subunit alcohol dehydrogenase family)
MIDTASHPDVSIHLSCSPEAAPPIYHGLLAALKANSGTFRAFRCPWKSLLFDFAERKAMDLSLDGKLALVSGSTAGIGFAIATALAQEGARVIINGRAQASVDAAAAQLRSAGGDVQGFAGDLSKADAADELARRYPNVEILVNNLGIFEPKPFEEIPDADWQRFFDVNVLSGVRLCRLFLPAMKRANWGRIIFISSESAIQIPTEMIHYGMTKTAQLAVSRGLAEAVAGTGITVNSVLPGPTRSRGVEDFVDTLAKAEGRSFEEFEREFFQKVRPTSLIKRFATTAEVASLVAYIASPLASATTGAALRVDGGVVKSVF